MYETNHPVTRGRTKRNQETGSKGNRVTHLCKLNFKNRSFRIMNPKESVKDKKKLGTHNRYERKKKKRTEYQKQFFNWRIYNIRQVRKFTQTIKD